MMRRFLVVPVLAALVAGACDTVQEGPTAPVAFGVAAPGTVVSVEVVVSLPGEVVIRESGPGNSGGTCEAGGAWRNPGGNLSSSVPHTQCTTVVDGVELEVYFTDVANYVQARSGNVQLNFGRVQVCDVDHCEESDDRAVHYNRNRDLTRGHGLLYAWDADGGRWTIDLSELSGPGNPLDPAGTPVSACNATHGCWPAIMTW